MSTHSPPLQETSEELNHGQQDNLSKYETNIKETFSFTNLAVNYDNVQIYDMSLG